MRHTRRLIARMLAAFSESQRIAQKRRVEAYLQALGLQYPRDRR